MAQEQELYLVFGGELTCLDGCEFRNVSDLDVVGIYSNHEDALAIWKAKAQSTVDNAHQRYFVVPLHEALAAAKNS